MSTTEGTQSKFGKFTNHQLERRLALEKIEQERQAAYSQGYKDGLKAVAEKAEREAPALDDGMYGGIATHALQEFAKAVRSLPIPEAK